MVHLGKPEIETVSTSSRGYSSASWPTGQVLLPAFIIHLFINVSFVGYMNCRYPLAG
jgi:hypothetical protein